jgi:hypothetical protein
MKKRAMKKIVLTKETLRNLEDREASVVAGGISVRTCQYSWCVICDTRGDC